MDTRKFSPKIFQRKRGSVSKTSSQISLVKMRGEASKTGQVSYQNSAARPHRHLAHQQTKSSSNFNRQSLETINFVLGPQSIPTNTQKLKAQTNYVQKFIGKKGVRIKSKFLNQNQ